jgi:hypothetical protein
MVQAEAKARQALRVQLEVFQVPLVIQVQLDPQVQQDLLVERAAQPDPQVLQVLQEFKDLLEIQVEVCDHMDISVLLILLL